MHLKAAPLAGHHSDEDPGWRAGQRPGIDSGIFQCAPRRLQQQSLLRVERRRLDRRDAEKVVVECVDVVDEMGASGVHRSGDTVGVVVGVDIPTLRGDFAVGDDTVHQQSPERVLVGRAREAAVDADHGDRHHGTTRSAVR